VYLRDGVCVGIFGTVSVYLRDGVCVSSGRRLFIFGSLANKVVYNQ
jgi:hypothetical protein